MLGNITAQPVSSEHVSISNSDREAAYAAYVGGKLARIMVLNMNGYNNTVRGEGISNLESPPTRASTDYTFRVSGISGTAKVQRLMAGGSDAISGITWDGWSYNYELGQGKPVRLTNVTTGETVAVDNGQVTVRVPYSSAAMLSF